MKTSSRQSIGNSVAADDLAGLGLFAGADLREMAHRLRTCPVTTLRKDQMLLAEGATNSTLYVVLRGRLRVHLDSPEGEPVRLIEAGEVAGEISLVDEKPASASVVADLATTVLAIDRQTFWELVNDSHQVARNILLTLVERMRANNVSIIEGMRLRAEHLRQSNIDPLTGLRNLHALSDALRRQLLRNSMNAEPLSVLIIDIDDFSDFNDEFGRAAGDRAIHTVAHALQAQLRPGDVIARMYGEKFAIVLPQCTAEGAQAVAARLCDAVAGEVIVMDDGSILPTLHVSAGIAESKGFDNPDSLLQVAEAALARAKGRDRDSYAA